VLEIGARNEVRIINIAIAKQLFGAVAFEEGVQEAAKSV
jgi:hypothetical protein